MTAARPLLVATISMALLAACTKQEPQAQAPRPVLAQRAVTQTNDTATVYSGEIRARHENDLAFRIGGKVTARYVDVGAAVKKGTVLARLDPQDAQLAVDASRSQLAAAESDYALAKAELERYRELFGKKFVSQAVLDAKESTFNTAKARVEQGRSQLATSRNQSSYTTLTADADGVITAVNIEAGQVVAAGQPALRFARPEEKEVVISVPEIRLAELRDAKTILVSVWAAPDKTYRGRIREIAPNADAATRTFTAKIALVDADVDVKLGMTANVAIGDRAGEPLMLLPLASLTEQNGRPAVWIVDPATRQVALRPVELGAYRENGAVIRSGVKPGEIVVTAGVHKLRASETVRLPAELAGDPNPTARAN